MKLWPTLALSIVFSMVAASPHVLAQAQGAEPDTVILVASPGLRDANYRQTVVIVVSVENDRHIGVIVNRPTQRTLSSLFPEHQPSKKVSEPVFFGGPMSRGAVVAVVKSEKDPGQGTIGLTKDMYLAMSINIVDKVIEDTPNDARYYVGYIVWRPGELRAEIDRKVWSVVNASPELVFRKNTSGLWEELTSIAKMITASLSVEISTHP